MDRELQRFFAHGEDSSDLTCFETGAELHAGSWRGEEGKVVECDAAPLGESSNQRPDADIEVSQAPFREGEDPSRRGDSRTIFFVEWRRLLGESLARCISAEVGCRVRLFSDTDALLNAERNLNAALIILTTRPDDKSEGCDAIDRLKAAAPGVPVIFLSESADVADFCRSLSYGARGHLPTSVALDVGVEALRLVLAGGVFVPADSFVNGQSSTATRVCGAGKETPFTDRQSAVVNALRRGKPNKLIAHELNMSESTVKVHIHNIMKKLGAKNRTEVAIKVAALG